MPHDHLSNAELLVAMRRAQKSHQPAMAALLKSYKAEAIARGIANPRTGNPVKLWNSAEIEDLLEPFIAATNTVARNDRLPERAAGRKGFAATGGFARISDPALRCFVDAYTGITNEKVRATFCAYVVKRGDSPVFALFDRGSAPTNKPNPATSIEQHLSRAQATFTLDNLLTEGLAAWRGIVARALAEPGATRSEEA